MNVTILTFGSWGDVEPYLSLGLGLKSEGYDVTVAAGLDFKTIIQKKKIQYAPIDINIREFLRTKEVKAALSGDRSSGRKVMREKMIPGRLKILNNIWDAAQGSHALIYGPTFYIASYMAEKLDIPSIIATHGPFASRTRAFPLPLLTTAGLGSFLNQLSYEMIRIGRIMEYKITRTWCRETLKMRPRSRFTNCLYRNGRPIPVLYCYSQLVLPTPDDWNDNTLASGYWFLEQKEEWQPPNRLEAFLADGLPPVYVGFGSMTNSDPEYLTQLVVSALQQSCERGIVCSGWGGIVEQDMPDNIYYIDYVPFGWLFPRVKAVVHHGGSGSVGAGLRYGKPTVVCPILPDQRFWGKIINKRGYGPSPVSRLPQKKFTAERLAAAIKSAATDQAMRKHTEELAKSLRKEDGVGQAVQFINAKLEQE